MRYLMIIVSNDHDGDGDDDDVIMLNIKRLTITYCFQRVEWRGSCLDCNHSFQMHSMYIIKDINDDTSTEMTSLKACGCYTYRQFS